MKFYFLLYTTLVNSSKKNAFKTVIMLISDSTTTAQKCCKSPKRCEIFAPNRDHTHLTLQKNWENEKFSARLCICKLKDLKN